MKKIGRSNSESASGVAGARHTTYGKITAESETLENHVNINTSSSLLIATVPKLVRIIDPYSLEFNSHSHKLKSTDFEEVLPLKIAFITEITLN